MSRLTSLNSYLLNIGKALDVIEEVKPKQPEHFVRLVVNPYVLTEETKRNTCAVTAHNLQQYKVRIYSISLESNLTTWLEKLKRAKERGLQEWNLGESQQMVL